MTTSETKRPHYSLKYSIAAETGLFSPEQFTQDCRYTDKLVTFDLHSNPDECAMQAYGAIPTNHDLIVMLVVLCNTISQSKDTESSIALGVSLLAHNLAVHLASSKSPNEKEVVNATETHSPDNDIQGT